MSIFCITKACRKFCQIREDYWPHLADFALRWFFATQRRPGRSEEHYRQATNENKRGQTQTGGSDRGIFH